MKRKNFAMRIAALLFILTMISTCAFATTFAKYVTDGSATDTARVAKWGVVVTAGNADQLFADDYNGTVASLTELDDLVAPGTSGTFADFTVSGAPEVKCEVAYSAVLTLDGWKVDGVDYCPIVFKINNEDVTGATMDELKANVEAKIAAATKVYEANTAIADTLDVSWSWAYFVDADTDAKE